MRPDAFGCVRSLSEIFNFFELVLCFIELIAKLWQLIQPDPQGLAINSVGPGRLALFFCFFSPLGGYPPQA